MAVGVEAIEDSNSIAYGPSGFMGLVKNPYILLQSFFASIGGLLYGYDQGVISGVLVMNNFHKHFPLLASDATLQGWMVSVLTLGAMTGALINGPIADRFSRRWSILYSNIVFLVGSAIQAVAINIPMIFVGRFIAGIAVGMLSMVVPLYISEVAPPNLRGSLVALQQLAITLGIMVAFWLDYGTQYIGGTGDRQSQAAWRFPLAFQCFPSLILILATMFLPYSPRWLVQADREEEARKVLVRIRRVPESDPRIFLELSEIKAATLFDRETKAVQYMDTRSRFQSGFNEYKQLFIAPHLNRRLAIACLLQLLQQFTGINAIIYYAPSIFTAVGLNGNSVDLLATGVVGIINFLFTIPAIMFIDRWGRRKVLMVGAVGMAVSQLIIGTLYAVYQHSWENHTSAGWAAAVFVWVYIAHFAFSIGIFRDSLPARRKRMTFTAGCVNWIIPSELFPPGVRSKAVSIAISTNWLTNFIIALITPRMLSSITFGTFYFFLFFCVVVFFWVLFCVPETRGIPIEDMDRLFGGRQGQEDLERMARIRARLGISSEDPETIFFGGKEKDVDVPVVEERE